MCGGKPPCVDQGPVLLHMKVNQAPGSKKRKRAPNKKVNPKTSKKKQPSNVKSARTRFKASTSNSGTCIFCLYFLDMDMDMDDSGSDSMAISSDDDSPSNSNADDGIS